MVIENESKNDLDLVSVVTMTETIVTVKGEEGSLALKT